MVDIDALRGKARRAAIRRTLYTVYPRPMGAGLIAEALPDDLTAGADELERVLYYLVDKGQVERTGQSGAGPALYRLTAAGVERVEAGDDFGAERVRGVRMLRLRVLQALDLGRPQPMGASLISMALAEDTDLDLSEPAIRRALAYLTEAGLARAQGEAWMITAEGIDYLGGDGEGVAGVARPLGW